MNTFLSFDNMTDHPVIVLQIRHDSCLIEWRDDKVIQTSPNLRWFEKYKRYYVPKHFVQLKQGS